MSKLRQTGNIKLIVLIGYIVLISLAIFGLVRIYKELVNFSKVTTPLKDRKELTIVSNALVALYEAESIREVMLSENLYVPSLKSSYDGVNSQVRVYIDSLYKISSDEELHAKLDSVNYLLDKKKKNFHGMMTLMDSIKNLPYSSVMTTKVLSKKDITDLGQIIQSGIIQKQDTSYYIKEKRSFIDRLRAVFVSSEDSTKIVKSEETAIADTLAYTPAEILTDTLVQYINTVNEKSDKRKTAYILKLSKRQNQMFHFDEMLTLQINNILRQIEEDEKSLASVLSQEKAAVLKRSSNIVSNIAFASLAVFIVFLTLTVLLVNRNQRISIDLEKSNHFAQKLLKSRKKLLLMISHDIKAPLSSIIGHIELMSHDKVQPEVQEHLNNMRASSEQILDLSNKLMDYHRLEQGKSEVNLISFVPHRLIDDIYKSFIPIADRKNLYIRSESTIKSDLLFESDPFILTQILNNLINNAIKFTEKGGVSIHSFINENNLCVTIKDTGIGILQEDVLKIFDEFERAGGVDEHRQVEGFGLGLPITKRLVDLLGGTITLDSEQGKGTEFQLAIPMKEVSELAEGELPTRSLSDEKEKLSVKLLWIDDDTAFLNIYSQLLERKGAKITCCHDSLKALELLKTDAFDMIFTDIQMPKMNGFELVKKIRNLGERYAEVPVIALSARSDVSEKDFKSAGFTSFLSKPISADVLYQLIYRLTQKNASEISDLVSTHSPDAGFGTLIEYVKDDKEISLDILTTFLNDSLNKHEELKKAIQTENWEVIQSLSHKMLPLMTMIGEEEMVRVLTKLEAGEKSLTMAKQISSRLYVVHQNATQFINKLKEE